MKDYIHAGIDLGGRKAAISVFVNHRMVEVFSIETKLKNSTRSQQLYDVGQFVQGRVAVCEDLFIEEPLIGRGVRASLQVAQCAGAVMALTSHATPYLIPVATWKKVVVGNGGADKKTVAAWLEATHPAYAKRCEGNQDRIDATCIGLYGVHLARAASQLRPVLEDL